MRVGMGKRQNRMEAKDSRSDVARGTVGLEREINPWRHQRLDNPSNPGLRHMDSTLLFVLVLSGDKVP
jgi:hypothetical protein